MNKVIKYAGIMIGCLAILVAAGNAFAWLHFDTLDLKYNGGPSGAVGPIGHGYGGTAVAAAYVFNGERMRRGLPPLINEKLVNALFNESNCRMSMGEEICDYTWKKDNFKSKYYLRLFKEMDINKDSMIHPEEAVKYYRRFGVDVTKF